MDNEAYCCNVSYYVLFAGYSTSDFFKGSEFNVIASLLKSTRCKQFCFFLCACRSMCTNYFPSRDLRVSQLLHRVLNETPVSVLMGFVFKVPFRLILLNTI